MLLPRIINVAEVARMFGKSRQWLYQRINGSIVNGKQAMFKQADIDKLCQILEDAKNEIEKTINEISKLRNNSY